MKGQLKIHGILIVLLMCLSVDDLFAQFTITGEIRPRTELRNGFKRLRDTGDPAAYFIEQRSRIYMDFQKEKLSLYVALQDVRMWGNTNQIYKQDPSLFNAYEAWAGYAFNDEYAFRIGRQALDYNNARFMGDLDWAQQGRSHDAVLFTKKNTERNCQLHLALAFNQQILNEPAKLVGTEYFNDNYKSMIFGWWNKKFDEGAMSVLFHNDGRQVVADTSMAHRQTYAVLGNYKIGGVLLDGELYYQGGRNGNDVQISALMATIHGTIKTDLTPITLGFEYLSGTARGEQKDLSFNPLYGTNHKFYGYMDYFYVGNYHGQAGGGRTSGLIDVHLKTQFKLNEKSNLAANLHYFASPVKIYEGQGTSGATLNSTLGTEVDLVYTLAVAKDIKLNVGYSQMFGTETMEAVKGGGDHTAFNNWAWAMIAFKPQLFTTRQE